MTSEGTVVECRGEEAAWGEGRHKSPTTPSISGTAAEEEAEKEQPGERAEVTAGVTAAREQEEALRSVASGQHRARCGRGGIRAAWVSREARPRKSTPDYIPSPSKPRLCPEVGTFPCRGQSSLPAPHWNCPRQRCPSRMSHRPPTPRQECPGARGRPWGLIG